MTTPSGKWADPRAGADSFDVCRVFLFDVSAEFEKMGDIELRCLLSETVGYEEQFIIADSLCIGKALHVAIVP